MLPVLPVRGTRTCHDAYSICYKTDDSLLEVKAVEVNSDEKEEVISTRSETYEARTSI